MEINIDNKFKIDVKSGIGFERIFGLMFTFKESAKALLFNFPKPVRMAIHSFYVFFPFLAVWLDDKDKISEIRIVKPFSLIVRPKKSFYKLIEIPINKKYKNIVDSIKNSRR